MSYDIYIGECVMRETEEETEHFRVIDGKRVYFERYVLEMAHPYAPVFENDFMTKNENHRHPGYSQWSEFCQIAGLDALFFDRKTGLMREHPGIQEIKSEHYLVIAKALNNWKATHPDAIPGFGEGEDYILARIIWLEWWFRYALHNGEFPAIMNF